MKPNRKINKVDNVKNTKKVIIFPLEIKSRDLIPRLEIASKFVEKNYHVIIGEQTAIHKNINHLPVGILFEKSIGRIKEKRFKKFISLGFKICSLDEEGLHAFHLPGVYKKSRLTDYNLKIASKIFVWGDFEKKVILYKTKFKKFQNKIINSGHNKINMWIKNENFFEKSEEKKIQKHYKNYIFLVSNFAYPHRDGDKFLVNISKKAGLLETEKDKIALKFDMDYRKFVFGRYLKLLKKLSENFPEKKIILRPHPSENIVKWKFYLRKLRNVEVVFKYDVSIWIRNCEYFVHSSCSTGLEAFFRGKNPISFLPLYKGKKNYFEKHISNYYSNIIRDENKIIHLIKRNKLQNKVKTKIKNIFPNSNKSNNPINIIFKHVDHIKCKKYKIDFNIIKLIRSYLKELINFPALKIESFLDKNLKQKFYFRNDINKIKIINQNLTKKKIIFIKKNIFLIR